MATKPPTSKLLPPLRNSHEQITSDHQKLTGAVVGNGGMGWWFTVTTVWLIPPFPTKHQSENVHITKRQTGYHLEPGLSHAVSLQDAPCGRLNGLMLGSRHRPPHHCPGWDLTAVHISPRPWKETSVTQHLNIRNLLLHPNPPDHLSTPQLRPSVAFELL